MAAPATEDSAPALPDYVLDPDAVLKDDVTWRYGRAPNYSKTRKFFEEGMSILLIYQSPSLTVIPGKTQTHAAGTLPALVENLVKNWEIEASFKTSLSDWRTVDQSCYTFSSNGGPATDGDHMLRVGTYNALITPNQYYDPENLDFNASHKTFKRMMPTFAWEVLEVYSGPPTVAFKWRHWGKMANDYVGINE